MKRQFNCQKRQDTKMMNLKCFQVPPKKQFTIKIIIAKKSK